jgi:hypothetical protein
MVEKSLIRFDSTDLTPKLTEGKTLMDTSYLTADGMLNATRF